MSPTLTVEREPTAELSQDQHTSQTVKSIIKPDGNKFVTAEVFYFGPQWLEQINNELSELLLLEPNWDSNGAKTISRESVVNAFSLLKKIDSDTLPKPFIAPVPNGGIDIEWNKPSKLLSIKVRHQEIRFLLFYRHDFSKNLKGKAGEDSSTGINELLELWEK